MIGPEPKGLDPVLLDLLHRSGVNVSPYLERSQAKKSDPRENVWHKQLCEGTLTLSQAQHAELSYKRAHG
jgi:hypothetical protein